MYFKIFVVAATLAVATARPQEGHGHNHYHEHKHQPAYSSQSFVLHQSHDQHQPAHHDSKHHEHSGAVVAARPQGGHKQEHKHEHKHEPAYSSQSFVLHQSHHEHQPAHHDSKHHEHHEEHYSHPKYEFEYKVADPHTGDYKHQHETRDGHKVKGVYSLHEADGTIRIVEYTADKHTGFNAVVKREGHAKHVEPVHHHHH